MPYITVDAEKNPLFLDETVTRAQFESLTADLLARTKAPFERVVKDAGVSVDNIDQIVLVGGSTRMPAVTELVKKKEVENSSLSQSLSAMQAVNKSSAEKLSSKERLKMC